MVGLKVYYSTFEVGNDKEVATYSVSDLLRLFIFIYLFVGGCLIFMWDTNILYF